MANKMPLQDVPVPPAPRYSGKCFRHYQIRYCGCFGCCLSSCHLYWTIPANSKSLRPAICSFPFPQTLVSRLSRLCGGGR